ncbi:uncharacterized protein TNCT_128211 [Trichonephila clavata]|uniref:Uncharacterized protein n=1 Tax=Trichonephila clavata TaxID=2740835 RepID=A0A8X6LBJ1_TRICU|nr:uncharacterized protein TNCT_128211 [Trichonephila clavata]
MANHISLKYQSLFILSSMLIVSLALETPENTQKAIQNPEPSDLTAASSVAMKSFKVQSLLPRSSSSSGSNRYGYPYLIAPTLSPNINSRSDDFEDKPTVSKSKAYGSKLSASDESFKKASSKKYKTPLSYGATRRLGFDDGNESSVEKRLKSYREPKYRNFDELESMFRPRRMDLSSPYSSFSVKPSRRPPVSPRDPYLSPSDEPSDSFYPTIPKMKSYSSPYSHRNREVPSYGAGKYEDPYDDTSAEYGKSSYSGPSNYPSTSGHYGYEEDYAIESNKPITGDIRKKLLDYAGASDLYEGEPDYLQEIARNKHKYGHVANDYYASGRHGYRGSYRDFPYVESKISIVKKNSS